MPSCDSVDLDLSAVRALRNAMNSVFSDLTPEQELFMRQRMSLISSDPDLRAAMLNQFAGLVNEVAAIVAGRVGRSASDFAVRNTAGALMGVLMAALLAAADDSNAEAMQLVDKGLAHLEVGLPL